MPSGDYDFDVICYGTISADDLIYAGRSVCRKPTYRSGDAV